MNLLVPCVVILFPLSVTTASEGHGIQQGHHHLKKLWKERVLTTVRKGRLLKKVARDSTRHNLKENLNDERTSKRAYAELAKINALLKSKLKRPIRKHHRSYGLINKKSPVQFLAERPSDDPNARARKLRSRFMPLANRPSTDFDEEVDEEVGSTRDTIQDKTSFQESRKSKNDSDEPIADDSDKGKESDKPALVGSVRVTKAHHLGADKGDMVLVHDDGHAAEEKESPVEEQVENKQNDEETTASEDNESDEDEDDEDEQPDDEETDDIVEQHSHSLNKMKKKPLEMSDQTTISQARMPNIENKQDQMNAVAERERQLQRLRKFFAQEKQQILRGLWLNYENTIDRNTAAQPSRQYVSPLAWGYPTGLPNAYLLLVPTVPIYQPAAFTGSEPPATANESSDKDTDNNQSYSISVDGLKGVFSKEPGLVVRFHSPNSEVTVTKRRNEVMRLLLPINDHK